MSKNTLLSNLINYISANSSGNVVIVAPTSGLALDVTGTGRFTGALTGTSATFSGNVTVNGSSIDINPASGQPNITLRTANTFRGYIEGNSAGGMSFGTGAGAAICLTLASNGQATFTNSVLVKKNGSDSANDALALVNAAGDRYFNWQLDSSGNLAGWRYSGSSFNQWLSVNYSNGNVGINTTATTGTYGKLSVAGGISILNDNNAKLEIGRYSSGIQNSYIKIGSNSNSLRITNSTDVADVFIFNNNGSSIQNGINVQLTKTGGTSIVFTLSLGSIGAWTPGYATIRVSGTRGGLQEHYAAMYFLKLVYFQGSNVTSVNNVSGDTGSASIGVTTAFTSGNTIMTITVTDVGTTTDYMIADIDASFQTGVGSIT
jgi:hypothetical protein